MGTFNEYIRICMNELITIFWIFITLVFIGFFAGYEIAFVSANRLSIELKKKQGKQSGIILSSFLEEPAKFIGSCLIGLNIFLVIYGLLFSKLLFSSFWNPFRIRNEYIRLVVDTFLSTVIVLIFGEFLPKAIFKAKNDFLVSFFSPVANLFHQLFKGIATLFVNIAQWILKYFFNLRFNEREQAFSHIDLEHFFQQTTEQETENEELNKELFENALSLPQVKVRQCLIPRTEIEAVEISTDIETVKQHFINTKLSKLVVYEDNLDNILGYIHQLDLFKKPQNLQSILLPIPVVPETMSATDLITKFTKERRSVAWVVDEFGGTAGIVTMEDVLEEIFGEIKDEYDVEEFVEKQLSENEFIFSGRLELDLLNEKYNLNFDVTESETLSGYIINKNEAIPRQKEVIIIDNYQFNILSVSDTRIETVKLKVLS